MPPMQPGFHANILHDEVGNPIGAITFSDNIRRLAVAAFLQNSDISIGAVELKDGDSDERASIKADATALTAGGDGGLLLAGRDGSDQYHLRMAGAVAAQAYTTRRALTDAVVRGDDGTTYTAIRASQNAGGGFVTTLWGLLVDARNMGFRQDTSSWQAQGSDLPSNISGRALTGFNSPYANAINVGVDNTGAAVLRPVEARDLSVAGDVASTLIGLLVNARLTAYQQASADFGILSSDSVTNASAISAGSAAGLYTIASAFGRDTVGAAVLRPIEGRAFNNFLNIDTSSLISLFVASGTLGYDTGATSARRIEGRNFDADADVAGALFSLLVAARNAIYRNALGDWARWYGDTPAVADGTASANVIGAYTNSQVLGEDNTGAATMRAIEARGAVAAQAYTLYRLFTDSVVRGDDGTTYSAVAARDADANGDFTETLIGLLVNSRNAIQREDSGDWVITVGNLLSGFHGRGMGITGQIVTAFVGGRDTTGAAVVSVPEARDFATITTSGDAAATLIGLLVNARNAVFDERVSDWLGWMGTSQVSAAGTAAEIAPGAFVYQPRESAFAASRRGKRFYTTHQTPDTVITGQTAFVDTTPTFLLRQNAGTVRVILRSITLHQTGTVAGGEVKITVAIDTADRFSAGGTSVVPQNANEESATASAITSFLTNPTASAAGAGTRYLVNTGMAASVGSKLTIEFKDGVLLSTTAALLVYTWAATTGPSWFFTFEWEEVA